MVDAVAQRLDDFAALCRQYGVRRLGLFGAAATGAFDHETYLPSLAGPCNLRVHLIRIA